MPPAPKRPKHPWKDLDRIVKKVWDADWRCVRKGNYIHCYPPDGSRVVIVKCTPSGKHYRTVLERELRQRGLDL